MGALGRVIPGPDYDWSHYDTHPLTAATVPVVPVPVVIGVNWYSNFDNPVWRGGRWWIGLDPKNLGTVRGGHCVCLEPGDQLDANGAVIRRLQDLPNWHVFYDQGNEGACVGFGSSRAMSLLNRKLYFARWLWDRAKATDEWSDTNPGDNNGTSVRAALGILKNQGHVAWKSSYADMDDDPGDAYPRSGLQPGSAEGISAYRWASTVDQVRAVLKSPASDRMQAVRVLNSWGTSYPHRVWLPYPTLQRLINEDGEVGLVTDR